MSLTKKDFLDWFDDPKAAEAFMVDMMARVKEMWRSALRETDVHRSATMATQQMTLFSEEMRTYFDAHYQTDLDRFAEVDAEIVDLMKSMRQRHLEALPYQVMSAVYQKSMNEMLAEDALAAPRLERLAEQVIQRIDLYAPAIGDIVDGGKKGRSH